MRLYPSRLNLNRCLKDKWALEESCKTIRAFKSMRTELLDLASTIESKIGPACRHEVVPAKLHVGMKSIPQEVLLRVIESMACERERCRLALVDRRFRDLVYATPHFRSTIAPLRMTRFEIQRRLQMSMPGPLRIELGLEKSESDDHHPMSQERKQEMIDNFALCARSASRWHSVTFGNHAPSSVLESLVVHEDLKSVVVVSLPSRPNYYIDDGDDEVGEIDWNDANAQIAWAAVTDSNCRKFFERWQLLCAKSLIMRYVPPAGSFETVESLEIKFDVTDTNSHVGLPLFLKGINRLRRLTITMGDYENPFA